MRVRSSVHRADFMEYQYLDAIEHNSWLKRGMAVRGLARFEGSAITGSRGSCMGAPC